MSPLAPLLLVDDREENLLALDAVLAPLGHPRLHARSGEQALRVLLAQEVAVILMDVRMPGIDGFETARLVKQRERDREVPIIFLTAGADEAHDVLRGYAEGAVDYVLKPIDADLLRSKVTLFADLRARQRALERSEALLGRAVDGAPIGMTLHDAQGSVQRVNPAFAELLGRAAEGLVGRALRELCAGTCADDVERAYAALVAGDEDEVSLELELSGARGVPVPALLSASLIRPEEDDEPFVLAQWVDLSARRRAEEARAALLLEQAARAEAEREADRRARVQALTDALGALELDELLAELVIRVADLLGAEGAQARVEGIDDDPLMVTAVGGRVLIEPLSGSATELAVEKMVIEGRPIGELSVALGPGRTLTDEERTLFRLAADRAALSVQRGRLFEQERRIAAHLQRGLLPRKLPSVEGLGVFAYYEAAGAEVGGDWYDAFALPGGCLGLVVGDVAGRGVAAASTMGQLRSASRAYALEGHGPAQVLERLASFQEHIGDEQLVTLVCAVVDPRAGTVRWTSAGHLPPLVHQEETGPAFLEGGSLPLCPGITGADFEEHEAALPPGAALVLYTDGLVERRGELIDVGLERLAEAVADGPGDPGMLCEHVLAEVLAPEGLHDDVTMLVVRLAARGEVAAPAPVTLDLPRDSSAPGRARAAIAAQLSALPSARGEDAKLLASELVTNALVHGGGSIRLGVEVDARRVRIEVSDGGGGRPRVRRRLAEGGWGLQLVEEVADEWGVAAGSALVWFELSHGNRRGRPEAVPAASLRLAG